MCVLWRISVHQGLVIKNANKKKARKLVTGYRVTDIAYLSDDTSEQDIECLIAKFNKLTPQESTCSEPVR